MNFITLNNGIKMPILGFGVYQLNETNNCEEVVLKALKNGFRLIDTASYYKNEEEVGKAIIKSGIDRKEIFITTKVWCDQISYEGVMNSFNESLKRLQTNYIDLYLIHWPVGDVFGAWRAMEELYLEGKIRAIGVSNFLNDRLIDLIAFNKIKPTVNQMEVNVFYQRDKELEFNQELNVQLQAWSPLARGRKNIFDDETLSKIAKKHNKTIAQIVIKWLIQRNIVVITKTEKENQMKENLDVFDFELSNEDFELIKKLNLNESCFFDQLSTDSIKRLVNYQNK